MPITMKCPGCKTAFDFENALEGKRVKCKSCGDIFRVEKPSKKPRDEDDDRPMPARTSRQIQEEDERKPVRRRNSEDERPTSRNRKPIDDEDERSDSRSRRTEDNDEDLPKKKISPLLIFGPIAALALIGLVAVLFFALRGKKKEGILDAGDIVQASAKSITLEVTEGEMGTLVVPDSGNTFGLLRKMDTLRKSWVFEPYDIAAGRRTGRVDLLDMNDPWYASISPDGKHLLVIESVGAGGGDPSISMWSIPENRPLSARKWNPYPPPAKGGFDPPHLYRAEFVGNDRVATFSTAGILDVWPLPTFDPKLIEGIMFLPIGVQIGKEDRNVQSRGNDKYQRESAFSADHKRLATWNGDGFTFASLLDGQETSRTTSVKALTKELWPQERFVDRIKVGPISFSPDGKILAGFLSHGFASREKHALCLWATNEQRDPVYHEIAANQLHESPALYWWGNQFVVTHGSKTDGMMIDIAKGVGKRQVMGPAYGRYSYGRDGRLWYAASDERTQKAIVHVVDGPNPNQLTEPDDYEQIVELKEEYFLRRIWLEPGGVSRRPVRHNPPLTKQLIRKP